MQTRHRHRRRLALTALADRIWRLPLGLAAATFAICGPAHALGHTDFVYYAVLIGLALSGFALPFGLIGLRHQPVVVGGGEPVHADPPGGSAR